MKTLLICPAERPAVGLLAQNTPLGCVSMLGQGLVEYWLANLAASGVKEVRILASDRPEHVERMVGTGSRWGITVEVVAEGRELTPAQALLKYERELDPASPADAIATLDHFPGSGHSLFSSYAECFQALIAWIPLAKTIERVGAKQVQPGVWVGSHARISTSARLVAPCWIGQKTFVGKGATVGPGVIVEDRSFVEGETMITQSYVGADTFVGRYSEINGSLALGSMLVNWENSSWAEIPDPFLLCSLRQPRVPASESWLRRLTELYARDNAHVPMAWKHFLINKES